MKRFAPPFQYSLPRFDPQDTPAAKRILSYFGRQPEGVSVYVLTSGTVTTTAPTDPSTIRTTYRGGYLYDISDGDAAVLTAAGYTVGDVPAEVPDVTRVTPGSPRPPHPKTWDDLSAYTWDEAKQFVWGSLTDQDLGVPDVTRTDPGTPRPPHPKTWDDLTEYTWDEAKQFLWGSLTDQ